MLWLTGCAMAGSDARAPCPPVVDYTAADQAQAADEVEALTKGGYIDTNKAAVKAATAAAE